MRLTRWWVLASCMTGMVACDRDGCIFSDERRYAYVVTHHLERGGPVAACCTINEEVRSKNKAQYEGCEADAPVKCAFAKDSKIEVVRVDCRPHSCEQAGVVVHLSGPNGNATCQFEAFPRYVIGGSCKPDAPPSSNSPDPATSASAR